MARVLLVRVVGRRRASSVAREAFRLKAKLGLTVIDLAKVLGVSRQTVLRWKRGDNSPSLMASIEILKLKSKL